jgi:hypothetical protein
MRPNMDTPKGQKPSDPFINWRLYKPYPRKLAFDIEFFSETIDFYCPECKNISTFRRSIVVHKPSIAAAIMPARMAITPIAGSRSIEEKKPKIISVDFICSRDDNHIALFIFKMDNNYVQKIGEYPSQIQRQYYEIKRYESLLGQYYIELQTAIRLNDTNVGIGAFVYLRRVLEKVLIDVAVKKYGHRKSWDLEKYRKSKRIDEIIVDLSDSLPEFLVSNRRIYKILSKGIHELDEEECLKYFDLLKTSLEEILDDLMEQEKKKATRKRLSIELSKIQ